MCKFTFNEEATLMQTKCHEAKRGKNSRYYFGKWDGVKENVEKKDGTRNNSLCQNRDYMKENLLMQNNKQKTSSRPVWSGTSCLCILCDDTYNGKFSRNYKIWHHQKKS